MKRGRNYSQLKEQEKIPEKINNKAKIYSSPEIGPNDGKLD